MKLSIELDREDDGRWIAEALENPGVMAYGATKEEAIANTERRAIDVIADRVEAPRTAAVGFERFPSRCSMSSWPTTNNSQRYLKFAAWQAVSDQLSALSFQLPEWVADR